MLRLQGAANFLGVFRLREVFDQVNGLDFEDVVESSRAEYITEDHLVPFESRDALFHRRVDDFGMLRHVLRRSGSRLPGSLSYLLQGLSIVLRR